jgi:hypothetical protein
MFFLSQTFPQGLKPGKFPTFVARINPCPFKTSDDAFVLSCRPRAFLPPIRPGCHLRAIVSIHGIFGFYRVGSWLFRYLIAFHCDFSGRQKTCQGINLSANAPFPRDGVERTKGSHQKPGSVAGNVKTAPRGARTVLASQLAEAFK